MMNTTRFAMKKCGDRNKKKETNSTQNLRVVFYEIEKQKNNQINIRNKENIKLTEIIEKKGKI